MIAVLYNNKWMLNTDDSNRSLYENLYTISNVIYDTSLNYLKPKLEDGIYIESATQEEIDTHNDSLYPTEISRRQLRLQWQLSGRDLSEIDELLERMLETTDEDKINKIIAKNAWNESITFVRTDTLMQTLGVLLLGSKQELNNFFQNANFL